MRAAVGARAVAGAGRAGSAVWPKVAQGACVALLQGSRGSRGRCPARGASAGARPGGRAAPAAGAVRAAEWARRAVCAPEPGLAELAFGARAAAACAATLLYILGAGRIEQLCGRGGPNHGRTGRRAARDHVDDNAAAVGEEEDEAEHAADEEDGEPDGAGLGGGAAAALLARLGGHFGRGWE